MYAAEGLLSQMKQITGKEDWTYLLIDPSAFGRDLRLYKDPEFEDGV